VKKTTGGTEGNPTPPEGGPRGRCETAGIGEGAGSDPRAGLSKVRSRRGAAEKTSRLLTLNYVGKLLLCVCSALDWAKPPVLWQLHREASELHMSGKKAGPTR